MTANLRAFRVLVRNELFRRVELAALGRYDELGELDGEAGWDADAWARPSSAYFDGARRPRHRPRRPRAAVLRADEHPDGEPPGRVWRVRQIFDDPDGDHDWGISAEVDLAASDEAGEAVVRVTAVGELATLPATAG